MATDTTINETLAEAGLDPTAPASFHDPKPTLGPAPILDLQPIDMRHAPRDGRLICLLVKYDPDEVNAHPLEDSAEPSWTIGHNNFDNDGEDVWRIVGWCWSQDHFTQGLGTPIGWAPWRPGSVRAPDPGSARIIGERLRQMTVKAYSQTHDDEYTRGDLAQAAWCYLSAAIDKIPEQPEEWPWAAEWWKPSFGTRDLEKAGALIAAEISRRLRAHDAFLALVVEACVAGGAERDYAAAEVAQVVPDHLQEEGIEVGHPHHDWGVAGAAALADELVLHHLERS